MHMHNLKSHFQQDFLAYCTRAVSVHLAMACVGCSFDSFSVFLLIFYTTTKSHENYVFLDPFSKMTISPQNNERKKPHVFYTGKLYGLINRYALRIALRIALSHSISVCFRSGAGSLADRLDLPYWLEKCLLHADHCQHSCSYSEAFVLFVCVCL